MKGKSKDKEKIGILKEDCALFSRLFIACQSRDGNLEEFFKFTKQAVTTLTFSHGTAKRRTEGRSCQVSQGGRYPRDRTANCNDAII